MWMPVVWATISGHVGVREPHCLQGHIILVACTATQGHSEVLTQTAAEGHVWVLVPTVSGICVDVCGLCYNCGSWENCPCDLGTRDLVQPLPGYLSGKTDPSGVGPGRTKTSFYK